MPRGRKPKAEPSEAWKVYVPLSLSRAVQQELLDPLTESTAYGERTKLVTTLLREWLSKRRQLT